MAAIYPGNIFPWTPRVDQVNVIWANDVNSLAAEIQAIETDLGTMPQVETEPYVGNSVSYSTVSARISDTLQGTLHPYAELQSTTFYCYNTERWGGGGWGHLNSYQKITDTHGFYNGSDLTTPCSGLFLVTGQQTWEWFTSGYCFHHLYCGGEWRAGHRWDWNFGSSGPSHYDPSRQLTTYFTWLGPLAAGTRIQSVSENGTPHSPYQVVSSNLKIYTLRSLPSGAQT